MNMANIKSALTFCSLLMSLSPARLWAAKIISEKACAVRIDAELEAGSKHFVLRGTGAAAKKVAQVEVLRSKNGASLGKVIKGNKLCGKLKGLELQAAGASKVAGGSGAKEPGASGSKSRISNANSAASSDANASSSSFASKGKTVAVDFGTSLMMSLWSTKGLYQNTQENLPTLSLLGFSLGLDLWPAAFVDRNSFLMQIFGLGVSYVSRFSYPDIQVDPPVESTNRTVGKISPSSSTMLIEGMLRYPYLQGMLVSEARVGYLSHSLKVKLTDQGALSRSPLRDVELSGIALGLKQRIFLIDMLRINFGFVFPLTLSGVADNTSEKTKEKSALYSEKVTSASGILGDFSVDGYFGMFKATLGLTYESFSLTVPLLEGGDHIVEQQFISPFLGIGVLL